VTRAPGASRRALGVVAVVLIAGGCASTSGLDIGYPAASANRAMLGSVAPLRIGISPVVDRRLDAVRIGSAAKGGADIVTSRPVPEIVHDALATEIGKNGHAVVTTDADAILAAEVDEFWLDIVPGYPEIQYVGKVATFVQSVTLCAIVLRVPFVLYLSLACAAVGVVSGANYVRYSLSGPQHQPRNR